MTLEKIIEKAKIYRLADMTGEHNIGDVMDELRSALVMAEQALRSYEHGNASPDLANECANKIGDILQSK